MRTATWSCLAPSKLDRQWRQAAQEWHLFAFLKRKKNRLAAPGWGFHLLRNVAGERNGKNARANARRA